MGEIGNNLAITGTKPRGDIGNTMASQELDEIRNHLDTNTAAKVDRKRPDFVMKREPIVISTELSSNG